MSREERSMSKTWTQKKMDLEKASKFVWAVKSAIRGLAEEHNIEMADGCVDIDIPAMLRFTDDVDIGGDYACIELRVYWEE